MGGECGWRFGIPGGTTDAHANEGRPGLAPKWLKPAYSEGAPPVLGVDRVSTPTAIPLYIALSRRASMLLLYSLTTANAKPL
jgi:hypothetical protein